jgi:hypothetical protein
MTTVYCEKTDFVYPLLVDVYYPIVEQSAYGNVKKQWILDKTLACNFSGAGTAWKEEVQPNVNITRDMVLIGRVRSDIRVSKLNADNAITNVILTNIRDSHNNPIYVETSGVRSGKSTIFEIASQDPIVGPFGSIEYFKLIIRRSENQAADV